MSGRYGGMEGAVKCPFFRAYGSHSVLCESFMDGAGNRTCFRHGADRERHMELYCCGKYDYCEVYRMVKEAKYDDED